MWTCWDSAESSVSRSWTTGLLGLLTLLPCRSVTALSCFPTPAVRNLCADPESLSLYSNRLWQSCSIFFSEHRFCYCLHTHSYLTHSSGYLFPLSSFSTCGYSLGTLSLAAAFTGPLECYWWRKDSTLPFCNYIFLIFPDVSGDHFPLSFLDYGKSNKTNSIYGVIY